MPQLRARSLAFGLFDFVENSLWRARAKDRLETDEIECASRCQEISHRVLKTRALGTRRSLFRISYGSL